MYKGTKAAVNLIKAYEFEQDVQLLVNYPLIESSYITKYTDTSKEVIRILDAAGTIVSGIGDAEDQSKLILIDTRVSYEITFQVEQVILGDYLHLKVNLYDKEDVLLTDSPISAIDGSLTSLAITDESLNQNDEYYFIRVILFNNITVFNAKHSLDIGFGNHLILNNSDAKYMSVELGANIVAAGSWDANNDLRIWDFKVRPLTENYPNGFVMISSIITSFIENNSEFTNQSVENKVKRFLLPYSTTLKNQFLDELFVQSGTPLQITVIVTDETVIDADNGIIVINAIGGVEPYIYSIDNGVSFQDSNTFINLSPGSYDIVVEDAESTQVTDTVVVAEGANNLTFEAFVVLTSRLDVSDGQITVLGSGGVPSYYYSINGVDYQVSNIFSGLAVDTYTVYIKDSVGVEFNKLIILGSVRDKIVTFDVEDELTAPVENANIAVISENYLTDSLGAAIIYLANGSYDFYLTKTGFMPLSLNNTAISEDIVINPTLIAELAATYDFENNIYVITDVPTHYIAYQLVDILPSGSNRKGASIRVNLDYDISVFSEGTSNVKIYYGIGSDAVTEPTSWNLIASIITTHSGGSDSEISDTTIVIADGEYLFIKNDLTISTGISDDANANLTLVDGSVVLPETGTALAVGSPLTWDKNINGGG